MLVRELMKKSPAFCLTTNTVAAAGRIMKAFNCGFIPIVEDALTMEPVGVITDRDIALFLTTANRPAGEILLKECYTPKPIFISPDAELREVEELLRKHRIRRVPVVNDKRRLVGVISLTDLASEAWKHRMEPQPAIAEKEVTEIFEALATTE